MKTTVTTTAQPCVQAGDWIIFNGTQFIVTEVDSDTCFSLKQARWYHKLWRWLKTNF